MTDNANGDLFAGILAAAARTGSASCSPWTQQSPLKGKVAIRTAACLCINTPNAHVLPPMLALPAPTPEVSAGAVLPSISAIGCLPVPVNDADCVLGGRGGQRGRVWSFVSGLSSKYCFSLPLQQHTMHMASIVC